MSWAEQSFNTSLGDAEQPLYPGRAAQPTLGLRKAGGERQPPKASSSARHRKTEPCLPGQCYGEGQGRKG